MTSAFIVGRAKNVWNEVSKAREEFGPFDHVVVIGSTGVDFTGDFDHWVSFHVDLFPSWKISRARRGFKTDQTLWTCRQQGRRNSPKYADVKIVDCEGGSSGLIAVMVALIELKCDKVILAGIPMDAKAGQYDTNAVWREAIKHRTAWEQNVGRLAGAVKSMSGWTQELLGAPTKEWFSGTVQSQSGGAGAYQGVPGQAGS